MTALCSGKICTIFPEKGALNFWKACTIALEYSGCMTLIVTIVVFISVWIDKHKPKSRLLTKFIYWLANIGVKKDGDDK